MYNIYWTEPYTVGEGPGIVVISYDYPAVFRLDELQIS
jgi:hypothetical protein